MGKGLLPAQRVFCPSLAVPYYYALRFTTSYDSVGTHKRYRWIRNARLRNS